MATGTHDPSIVAALDKLEAFLADLIVQYPDDADFWSAFAGEADEIAEAATPDDSDYARGRIDCMLKNAGKIPGEDEGAPCR